MNHISGSYKPKVALIVTVFTALVFLLLFFIGINHRKYAYEDSKLLAKEMSRKAAIETELYLSSALMTARTFEQKAQIIRKYGGSRVEIIEMLKVSLIQNPNFLGAWTMWEPNTFDNNDKKFIGDTLYDLNGTMSVTFFKDQNCFLYERNETTDYQEDFYAIPKNSRQEVILDPFYYQYHGHSRIFYETSAVVPILIDTAFLGVFGIDINLETMTQKLNDIKLYGSGYFSLISNNGVIVSHKDTSQINKNIFSIIKETDSTIYKTIKNGQEYATETNSEFTGKDVFRFFYPINLGNSGTHWSMMVEIPIQEAATRSKQLFNLAIGTFIVGILLIIYLIYNIFDQRRYEKTILAAKFKAEESDRFKSAFLNNISHEIRTPLNGILGFVELLTESEPTQEQIKKYKNIIDSSSKQLLFIITNVLELSKIQAKMIERVIGDFDIESAILAIIEPYKSEIHKKGLKIVTKFPDRKHKLSFCSDIDKFKAVLNYLLNNAVKFTLSGFIEIGYHEYKDSIQFYVKDTGIGISPANAKIIFKFFTQEDQSQTRHFGGLGVGLSIAKALVEFLEGSIRFESTQGKGTTFFFTLPYLKQ